MSKLPSPVYLTALLIPLLISNTKKITIINSTHNPYDFEYDIRIKIIEGKESLSSIQIF